jgi:aldehyde dehydrogenase
VIPLDPGVRIGAQASAAQFSRVRAYLDLAREEGAEVICGGGPAEIEGFENGFFIQPTVLDNVSSNMRVACEEIFGPVISVIAWDDEADMLREVNDVEYGLGGGLWTKNLSRAHRISRAMETGTVWINRYFNMKAGQPIGGYKQSGFGRENALETLNHYTVSKSVVVNLVDGPLGPPSHF